jgi:hypothetical protein
MRSSLALSPPTMRNLAGDGLGLQAQHQRVMCVIPLAASARLTSSVVSGLTVGSRR